MEIYLMKKIILMLTMFFLALTPAFADDKADAIRFFNDYVKAANTYNPVITTLYSPNAKIIRQVVKPDGTTANAYTDTKTYITQMKLSQSVAKLRKYTNSYSDIKAEQVSTGYKISALRQPAGESYKLKTYMVVTKQPNGKWLITEEMMQTKEQIFLRYTEEAKSKKAK